MAYSRGVADAVLAKMAEGISLREACRAEGMPSPATIRLWVVQDIDGLAERYARARKAQADHWADEILETSDDGSNDWVSRRNKAGEIERAFDREHVQRSALRVDARKWLLAKLHPNIYGDRIATQQLDKDGNPADPAVPAVAITITRDGA